MLVDATRLLWILTPVTATVSLVFLSVALTTNEWLHSEERMPNKHYNGTKDEQEFLSKFTVSGLWKICSTDPGKLEMKCIMIDYFPNEEYSPDPNDSTNAIPYAVTRAAAFYFVSTIMLLCGEIFCLLGHFLRKKPIFTFVSGCIFIMAGLVMLGGLVIYISTFKTEVGRKLQPQSLFQDPLFEYSYGYSFLLVVSGFMTSELAGTFAIFLYINLHHVDEWPKREIFPHGFRGNHHQPQDLGGPYDDPPAPPCRRHQQQQRNRQQRRNSRSRDNSPRDNSPRASTSCGANRGNPALPLSDSMRDLAYFNFPPISRDHTCNTVSTTADINRDYSREFSYETLRRTTPV